MKTMHGRVLRRLAVWMLLAGGVAGLSPAPATAQDVRIRQECRCVDRDGHAIEDCRCLRTPDVDGLLAQVMPLRTRARIGITIDPSQSAEDDARGARITGLMDEGPAAEAGLREGDVVVALDGHGLFDPLDRDTEEGFDLDESIPVQRLLALARSLEPGQEVEVEYLRNGERLRATITTRDLSEWGTPAMAPRLMELGERLRALGDAPRVWTFRTPRGESEGQVEVWPDEDEARMRMRALGPDGARVFALARDGLFRECPEGGDEPEAFFMAFGDRCLGGVELVALKPGLAEYFGTEGGVLVADVHPESPLGLQPGDVILSVGEREVRSPDHARRILTSYQADEEITLHIMRRSREMSVQGRLGG